VIEEGKVMGMKVSEKPIDNKTVFYYDVYKPGKSIRKMTQLEDGEEYENWNYSRPLTPNWRLSLFGIGYFSGVKETQTAEGLVKRQKNPVDDALICRVTFSGKATGDLADPNNPKYICKKDIWFKVCKLKVIDTKYSNKLYLSVNARTDLEVSSKKIKLFDIVEKINKRVKENAMKVKMMVEKTDFNELPKDKAKKLQDLWDLYKKFTKVDYIPIIDLAGINEYHMTHRAILGEDGKPMKDDSGVWDAVDFNSFALCECAFTGIYEREGQAPKFILSDYSLGENENVFSKFSNGLSKEIPPSSVYISLTTSRGNQAYDPETKQFVKDPENAVAIPKIKGVGVILDFSKLNIESLIGDM